MAAPSRLRAAPRRAPSAVNPHTSMPAHPERRARLAARMPQREPVGRIDQLGDRHPLHRRHLARVDGRVTAMGSRHQPSTGVTRYAAAPRRTARASCRAPDAGRVQAGLLLRPRAAPRRPGRRRSGSMPPPGKAGWPACLRMPRGSLDEQHVRARAAPRRTGSAPPPGVPPWRAARQPGTPRRAARRQPASHDGQQLQLAARRRLGGFPVTRTGPAGPSFSLAALRVGRALAVRGAQRGQRAGAAGRPARVADAAAVPDQPVRQVVQSLRGISSPTSCSILTGSVLVVQPKRRTSRPKWVSTVMPGTPKALPSTTLAVLRPTPGSVTRSSSRAGHLAAEPLDRSAAAG